MYSYEIDPNIQEDMVCWRHHLHQIPELALKEEKTASFVAALLRSFGCDVVEKVGGTGVVGSIHYGPSNRSIGFRAEMDALPLLEKTNKSYRSKNNCMHACGHDGHMAMLLGAAKILSQEITFDGTIRFIFQPAEEETSGARHMINDGFFERFSIDEIYGLHNVPFIPEGSLALKSGGIMSGEDDFGINIRGEGCHASTPHLGADPFLCFSEIYQSLQLMISRCSNPLYPIVLSFTEISSNGGHNIIPSNLITKGDARCFRQEDQTFIEKEMSEICQSICHLYGAKCDVEYHHECRPVINDNLLCQSAIAAAIQTVGEEKVIPDSEPWMASEDFSNFLEKIPGCYALLGTGVNFEKSPSLHSPFYDFNDRVLPIGASYFVNLAKERLA